MGYNPWGRKESDMAEQLTLLLVTDLLVSLRAQSVKNLSGMWETPVRYLG